MLKLSGKGSKYINDRLIGEAGLEPRFDVDRDQYPYDWMFERNCAKLGFLLRRTFGEKGTALKSAVRYFHTAKSTMGSRMCLHWQTHIMKRQYSFGKAWI